MTGDKIIVEKTARGYRATAIPAELEEFELINRLTAQNRSAQVKAQEDKAAADHAYWERNRKIVELVFGSIAVAGALLGLAHLGAIAGWVAHLGILAVGIRLGQEFKVERNAAQ